MKNSAQTKVVLLLAAQALVFTLHAEEPRPFKQAIEPLAYSFPADHASHAGYQTEWWYVTGNVNDEKGREFGYQFTIFRRAMSPKDAKERGRTSNWAANDFYLLHLAISDINENVHVDYESLERGTLGIAGATDVSALLKERRKWDGLNPQTHEYPNETPDPSVRVWTKEASFERNRSGWKMKATTTKFSLDLDLKETTPFVKRVALHGKLREEGLSRKGPKLGQASYYYSVPRLETSGSLTLDGKTFSIKNGQSWMDHEFGSNQLSADQAGWEWFSIQLDNGCEYMLYVLRNKDGSIERSSSGTWIDADGNFHPIALDKFTTTPGRVWKSPRSGEAYPVEWTLKLPNAELRIKPAMDDQEFHSEQGAKMNYYEGAIRVEGTVGGKPVRGTGYLEITGKNLGGRM